jgi:choline dehydrogenase-like flavoprotein
LQTRQISPKERLLRKYDVGNGVVSFEPNANPQNAGRLHLLRRFLRETGCSTPKVTEIARKIVEFSCPGDGLINSLIEQAPNPDSRIDLVDETDSLGLRRVRINWQLLDRDHKTIRTLAVESAKEMARLDRARVKLAQFILDENQEIEVIAHCHHMGTTRMSKYPRHGVVDENCKVHGIGNLFLAGSSVFPTGGGTNPTPTIVMLALRLAEFVGKYD